MSNLAYRIVASPPFRAECFPSGIAVRMSRSNSRAQMSPLPSRTLPTLHRLILLFCLAIPLLAIACGNPDPASEEEAESETLDPVRWRKVRDATRPDEELTEEQRAAIAQVEKLGYVDGAEPAPEADGVTVYSREHAQPGLNFFVSSHDTYAALMDMEGNILHEWSSSFDKAFPDYPNENEKNGNRFHWRRTFLRPGGNLIAIHEGMGMVCLDRDSNVLWSRPNKAHHDMDFLEDGRIIALVREGQFNPRFGLDEPVLLDYVAFLSPEGERLHRISIDQAYLDSEFEAPNEVWHRTKNLYHANTLEILDGRLADRLPAFAEGNLLLSLRNIDQLAVLDPESERIVWIAEGSWKAQHQPTVLDKGNLLLFDNKGGDPVGGRSRILELDPMTLDIVWTYEGTPQLPFDSHFLGTSSRLPNGNTIAVESLFGRVIEVTPDQLIAWEYINPQRAGENSELIAVIPDLIRIDPAEVDDWLELPAGLGSDVSSKDEASDAAPSP